MSRLTIQEQACKKVPAFRGECETFIRKFGVAGKSSSCVQNYLHQISKLVLFYGRSAVELTSEEVEEFLIYLGRHTHRVAISNNRIKEITGDKVTFSYIDRKDNDTKKVMSLTGQEFLRRFIMHIMPYGFTRIRHYGFLSSRNKSKSLNAIRKCFKIKPPEKKQRTWVDIVKQRWGFDPFKCSECGGQKIFLRVIPRQRAPPLPLWKNPQATIKHVELAG